DNGPKAGNFLSFLDRDFVVRRFQELPVDKSKYWEETSVTQETMELFLTKEKSNLASISVQVDVLVRSDSPAVIEFFIKLKDGKIHCRRLMPQSGTDL